MGSENALTNFLFLGHLKSIGLSRTVFLALCFLESDEHTALCEFQAYNAASRPPRGSLGARHQERCLSGRVSDPRVIWKHRVFVICAMLARGPMTGFDTRKHATSRPRTPASRHRRRGRAWRGSKLESVEAGFPKSEVASKAQVFFLAASTPARWRSPT